MYVLIYNQDLHQNVILFLLHQHAYQKSGWGGGHFFFSQKDQRRISLRMPMGFLVGLSKGPVRIACGGRVYSVWLLETTSHYRIPLCWRNTDGSGWPSRKKRRTWTITIDQLWERHRICFNATFSNISAISWRPVLLVERTTDPGQATGKLYHILNYT